MAVFRDDQSEWNRRDWLLLLNGPIALYWQLAVLDDDRDWLANHGYHVYRLDCGAWNNLGAFHCDVRRVLEFPVYYGENLDAFNDCLSDLPVPDEGGVAFEFRRFDAFASREPIAAQVILDIVAANARLFLLTGRRVLALVQSDDPRIAFHPVGACPVMWNPREWMDANRNIDCEP